MDDVVTKPVLESDLVASVARWTARTADAVDIDEAADGVGAAKAAADIDVDEAAADIDEVALDMIVELDPDGDKGVIDRLCASFLDEAGARVAELKEAVSKADAETVRSAAHRLKGSSMYFGARAVTAACRRLEEMGRDGDLAGAALVVDPLATEIGRLRNDLPATVERLRRARVSGP